MNKEKYYVGYPKDESSPEGFKFARMNFDGVKLIIEKKSIYFEDSNLKNVTIEFCEITLREKLKRYFKIIKSKLWTFKT